MGLDALLRKRFTGARHQEAFELNIHLVAEPGITVLLGPSGSGKTSTLNCIGGFAQPDSGRILLNGQILFDAAAKLNLPPEKRRCGYIFQDHALFPHMTVRDNLIFAAQSAPREQNSGLSRRRQMKQLLESFELDDLASRKPAQLSGGQKQRAALARIFISAPQLLLLDEPTRGLDARLRESFYELLQQTGKRLQVPVLLITHDVEECLRVANYICLLENGRFLQSGSRQSVAETPATVAAARALGIFNLLAAEIIELDPVRRSSRLRLHGFASSDAGKTDIVGPHLPQHLLGDRGIVCFRESEIEVFGSAALLPSAALVAPVLRATDCPSGVRLKFADELHAFVPHSKWEALRGNDRLHILIPPQAIQFLG